MQNNKHLLCSFVVLSLFFYPLFGNVTDKKQVWILVHGTFAQKASKVIPKMGWWKPEHSFHQELVANTNNATVHSFDWCGSNSHEKRVEAGTELAKFITTIASDQDEVHLIGHSHGANVATLGAHELKKLNSTIEIDTLFSLGVPVASAYYPLKSNIKKVYNLFSYADFVQTVIGLFERVYPEEDHIHNLQVKINGICPNHHSIHSPIIARYLPKLSNLIPNSTPHAIHFFHDKDPVVQADLEREKDLKIDKNFTTQLITSFAESKKHGCKTLSEMSEYTKARFLRLRDRGDIHLKSMFESKS